MTAYGLLKFRFGNHHTQNSHKANPASNAMIFGGKADYSIPSSAEVKNHGTSHPTSLYTFL
jgi:hypothetical protein